LGVKKAKTSLRSPKTEFGLQNQYGRVTYPSIGNFTWSKKKCTFEGHKGKNKLSEPKNGIKAPKSVWSCVINRKFYEKVYFWGSKRVENKPSEPNMEFGTQNQYREFYIDEEMHAFQVGIGKK
jgi:hypothetical protein